MDRTGALERVGTDAVVRRPDARHPPQVRGAAHAHHVGDGEVEVVGALLGDDSDRSSELDRPQARYVCSGDGNHSGTGAQRSVERAQQGGLAAPVGADDGEELTTGHVEIH